MKNLTFLFLVCILTFSSTNAQNNEVPYTIANRYFVKNNYPDRMLHMLKITDEEKFESIFGMATVMGEGGQPTPIDFTKSFVITLIDDVSNTTEDLTVKTLTKDGNKLNLEYDIKQKSEPGSASFRFFTILIVDNAFMGTVSARRFTDSGQFMVGDDLDEKGCKPSTGSSWSELENNCIAPWESIYVLNVSNLSLPLLFNKDRSKAEIMGLNHTNSNYETNIILKKTDKISWENDDLILIEKEKDQFILKVKVKEIGKGNLRK